MNRFTFDNRIREIRRGKRLTLAKISRDAGISVAYLSDIELGNRHGSDDVLQRIADALGVTVTDLGVS